MINEFDRAQEITSRYVLPVFEEKTANGYKRYLKSALSSLVSQLMTPLQTM
jgi:hypothetical protein